MRDLGDAACGEVVCVGLSHRTAAVEVRERYAVAPGAMEEVLARLVAIGGISEAVVVSTCNRVEAYAAGDGERAAAGLMEFFAAHGGAEGMAGMYRHRGAESARHLFRIVSGLDSMVVGETEVFGQVKRAYEAARKAGVTGRCLNRLFQRAFRVGKAVRAATRIGCGQVSVGSVAVDLAEKIFGDLSGCRVMVVGAGETGEATARALLARGTRSVFVANRSYDRAVELAEAMGGRAVRFESWREEFAKVDIVICSTAAPHPIVTREKVAGLMAGRLDRPLFVIDLAVPRDVEAAVNDLEGVYVYDIDSLRALAEEAMAERVREVERCEAMIAEHVGDWAGQGGGAAGGLRAEPEGSARDFRAVGS